jgi:imidazolonepropionase-like amidohydrolase
MGTDSGVGPHGHNLEELPLMAACGMSPAQVWRSTTLGAAELLGVADEFGSLEPGKRADVVVLDGAADDLEGLAGRVREVYRDGELVAAGGLAVEPGILSPR